MLSLFSLEGKVALITGATNGIGLGMAKGLAEANVDQLILTFRSQLALEAAIAEIRRCSEHVTISSIEVDLSSQDDVASHVALEAYRLSRLGRIDILINNAGISRRHPFELFPQDDFDAVLRVNLAVPVKLTQAVGRRMLAAKTAGRIVFTASLMSFQGGVETAAYAITKGGINQFTKALSNEWSPRGIRVNAIAPGYIATNLTDSMLQERRATVLPRIPIGRWGHMDDFKGPAVFLTSDASAYVTGETLLVDGGWMGR